MRRITITADAEEIAVMNQFKSSRKIPKTIAAAVSAALMTSFTSLTFAGTTIVFSDNTTPISPFPAIDPANTSAMASGREFRVIINGAISGGGEKTIIPTASWIFDNSNQMTAVANTQVTPGAAAYGAKGPDGALGTGDDIPSAAPGGAPGLFQNAPFLGSAFGFLAPTVGSAAGNAYGPATITISGSNLEIFMPTVEAQWSGGPFLLGAENNRGITFSGTIAGNGHDFRINAAHTIRNYEDSLGFAGQETQWDLVGVLNSDPHANITSYSTDPASPVVIPVASIATDREGDTISITSLNPTASGSAGGSVICTANDCTYTPAGPGTATFTVTVVDNFSTQGTASIALNIQVTTDAVANNDSATVEQNSVGNIIGVAANDTDADGTIDLTSIAIASGPSHGSIDSIPGDGTILYTPDSGFIGTDTLTYTIDDDAANTSQPATVTITVNAAVPSTASGPVTAGTLGSTTVTLSQLLSAGIPQDTVVTNQCNPNCFDFVATTSGGTATVVLPLSGPLPSSAQYRKYISGAWRPFDTSSGDTIRSALGSLGSCPPPGHTDYVSGLSAGRYCIELTIADGGPNDGDNIPGQVTDPGGPGNGDAATVVLPGQSLGGGCSMANGNISLGNRMDLWLLAGLLAWLGIRQRRAF